MFYDFPKIEHINDVLPYIDDNFIIANKGEYTVINYILPDKETFPPITDLGSAVRRECRGIIFCNVTGKIIRRTYNKFFNCGEREDISEEIVLHSMMNCPYKVLDKIDGSMVSPFKLNSNKIIFGTKMGDTHITPRVEQFVKNNPKYMDFSEHCISLGLTPIYEWFSPEDRIVIDYGEEPLMTLTAVRHMIDGNYVDCFDIAENVYDVPAVRSYGSITMDNIKQEQITNTTDEGYVIRFDNGHMIKIKHDHYCKVHRAKSSLTKERHIVDLILNEKIDDLKPLLEKQEIESLEDFEVSLHQKINDMIHTAESNHIVVIKTDISRKDLAINYMNTTPKWLMDILFKQYGKDFDRNEVRRQIIDTILKNCSKDIKYKEACIDGVLCDIIRWKPIMFSGDN